MDAASLKNPPAGLVAAVAEVLAQADADVAARRPVCRASGRCCHFEEYGHRLYVTAAELAYFAARLRGTGVSPVNGRAPDLRHGADGAGSTGGTLCPDTGETPVLQTPVAPARVALPQFFAQVEPRGCPYQVDGLCTARQARPLGCRVYFCDAGAQSWQNAVYETYHVQLRALHAAHALDYAYMEWRAALRQLPEPEELP